MKKISNYLLALVAGTILWSCEYDDFDVWKAIDDLKEDVASLKEQTNALQTVIDAYSNGKMIANIEDLADEKGYKITFGDGKIIEVISSASNPPQIGVQEENGVYYWTITTNGQTEFILDAQSNKLPVTAPSPRLAIDRAGYWTVDGVRVQDATGKNVKAQGDSFFKDVENGTDKVTFTLADGRTSFTIDKSLDVYFYFVNSGPGVQTHNLVAGEDEQVLSFLASGMSYIRIMDKPEGWTATVNEQGQYVAVSVPATAKPGEEYEISLRAVDKKGLVYMAFAKILITPTFDFSDPKGVFILNEGNMSNELGALSFLSYNGAIIDSVYYKKNGTFLGNVPQDLFIDGQDMWIITQNGKKAGLPANDGMLVKVNARTMQVTGRYDNMLRNARGQYVLSWPTHIAATGMGRVFIRDNKGIYVFDPFRRTLTFVEGTEGAAKNRMAVVNGRLFAPKEKSLLVIDGRYLDSEVEFEHTITGVIPSKEEGYLWVSTSDGNTHRIYKIDAEEPDTDNFHNITEGSLANTNTTTFAVPAISAKGDTIYYTGATTTIYRHIYSTNHTQKLVDVQTIESNAVLPYSSVGVNPETGYVYMASMASYAEYNTNNNILVLRFDDTTGAHEVISNLKGHIRFPAGFFFRGNFPQD